MASDRISQEMIEAAKRNLPPLYDSGGGPIDKYEVADAAVRGVYPLIRAEVLAEVREALLTHEALTAARLAPADGDASDERALAGYTARLVVEAALSKLDEYPGERA
jgi:hypothetical protein